MLKSSQVLGRQGKSSGLGVTTELGQETAALVQGLDNVELGDTAAASAANLLSGSDDDGWTIELLG
jgi:hypothetical protein